MNRQEELNGRLKQAAKLNDLAGLTQSLEDGAHAKAQDSYALGVAAESGHAECVRLLIPASDPLAGDSYALQLAARGGHVECVKLLIPASDPLTDDSLALRWAAREGHAECVELLLPVSGSLAMNSWALRGAALRGHVECVALLLPVSEKWAQAASLAREQGFVGVAGMIEAFMEAAALSGATISKGSPRAKSAL
jgi:ankyrin repeat protein